MGRALHARGRAAFGGYRGSRKRLRITLRGNWSIALWIWLVFMALVIFLLLPWLIMHPPDHDQPGKPGTPTWDTAERRP